MRPSSVGGRRRAVKVTNKLKAEVKKGIVQCVSKHPPAKGTQVPPIRRLFHVVNVHVLGGPEVDLLLMEHSRTIGELANCA
jgi:hypothetical protein